MYDLISRKAALEAMDTWDKFGCDTNGKLVRCEDDKHYITYVHYEDMVHAIKNSPSAEPKKGKWMKKPDPYGFFDEIPVCSECGCTTKCREEYKYCPNCGAKMEVNE